MKPEFSVIVNLTMKTLSHGGKEWVRESEAGSAVSVGYKQPCGNYVLIFNYPDNYSGLSMAARC